MVTVSWKTGTARTAEQSEDLVSLDIDGHPHYTAHQIYARLLGATVKNERLQNVDSAVQKVATAARLSADSVPRARMEWPQGTAQREHPMLSERNVLLVLARGQRGERSAPSADARTSMWQMRWATDACAWEACGCV